MAHDVFCHLLSVLMDYGQQPEPGKQDQKPFSCLEGRDNPYTTA